MRRCTDCGREHNRPRAEQCRACYARLYRARNLDKSRAAQRHWYQQHRERVLAYRKEWNKAHAAQIKARKAAQYLERREAILRASAPGIVRVPVRGWGFLG